jgi:methyltransferase (TIGR00027 family)
MSQEHPTKPLDASTFVPFSARLVAAMRARETAREDALFQDPFADQLAGPEAYKLLDQKFTPQDIAYLAVRTRYFDDFIQSAAPEAHQLVIVGAGMDTRAFRLPLPEQTIVYELDQSAVLAYKNSILEDYAPQYQRHTIAADVTQPWKTLLIEAGFDPDLPSIWLLEGLLMYLSEAAVHDILTTVSTLANPNSKLILDMINLKTLKYQPFKGYFKFGTDHPESYLARYGWESIVKQPGEDGASFGRFPEPSPTPKGSPDVSRAFLITAQRTNGQ